MNNKLLLMPTLVLMVGCSSMTKTVHERCMEVTHIPDGLSADSTEQEVLDHYKVKSIDEAKDQIIKETRWEFQKHGTLERCYAQKQADDQSWADLAASAGQSFRNASKMSPEAERAYYENQRHAWDAGKPVVQQQIVIQQEAPHAQPARYRPFK